MGRKNEYQSDCCAWRIRSFIYLVMGSAIRLMFTWRRHFSLWYSIMYSLWRIQTLHYFLPATLCSHFWGQASLLRSDKGYLLATFQFETFPVWILLHLTSIQINLFPWPLPAQTLMMTCIMSGWVTHSLKLISSRPIKNYKQAIIIFPVLKHYV